MVGFHLFSYHLSQNQTKGRAAIQLALGPHPPAVPMDDTAHRGQTNAAAFKLVFSMQPLKHVAKVLPALQ
jgi:hypothetical protein